MRLGQHVSHRLQGRYCRVFQNNLPILPVDETKSNGKLRSMGKYNKRSKMQL